MAAGVINAFGTYSHFLKNFQMTSCLLFVGTLLYLTVKVFPVNQQPWALGQEMLMPEGGDKAWAFPSCSVQQKPGIYFGCCRQS